MAEPKNRGRLRFLQGLGLGIIGLPATLKLLMGSNAQAQSPSGQESNVSSAQHKWKLVTTWPPNFPILGEGCTLFADWVKKMSGGRMQIQVFGGCLLYTSPSPRDATLSRMPSSA